MDGLRFLNGFFSEAELAVLERVNKKMSSAVRVEDVALTHEEREVILKFSRMMGDFATTIEQFARQAPAVDVPAEPPVVDAALSRRFFDQWLHWFVQMIVERLLADIARAQEQLKQQSTPDA